MYILLLILFVLLIALSLNKAYIYKENFMTKSELQEEYRIFSSNKENMNKMDKFFEALDYRNGFYFINGKKIKCSDGEDKIEENIII